MQQVTNYSREYFELSFIVLIFFKYMRVFFFPRLTDNLFFVLNYRLVFLSHSNILLGRDGEGTSSYRNLFSLERDLGLSSS